MIFKALSLLAVNLVICMKVYAQQPQPVYTFVKQKETVEWNKAQALAWKQVLEKDPANALGWEYYYQANHNIHSMEGGGNKALTAGMTDSLRGILDKMAKAVPNSFEYNYDMHYYGSQSMDPDKYYPYLVKAYEIDSTRSETYEAFATAAELKNDQATRKKFMNKWYNSNKMSPGFLNWNYNVLMSLAKNAVLFTGGDDDTYPAWMLQDAKGVRTDVKVINISLFYEDSYRKLICKDLGIPYPEDVRYNDAGMSALGKWIIEHITNRPVYFVEGAEPVFYKTFEDSMYLEGLALHYSPKKYDNIAVLKKNVEERFLLDYLKVGFTNDISQSLVDYMNSDYIAPFIKLYEYYNDKGNKEQAKYYKEMAMAIGGKANMKKEVEEALNKTKK